jgi:transposase
LTCPHGLPQSSPIRAPAEKLVRDNRRATRKRHSAEDKSRIVLEGVNYDQNIEIIEK